MKLTGEENVYAMLDPNGNYTQYGITLKQHMVVEFTKAIYANPSMTTPTIEERYTTVREAILLANEVIKQLNDEDK